MAPIFDGPTFSPRLIEADIAAITARIAVEGGTSKESVARDALILRKGSVGSTLGEQRTARWGSPSSRQWIRHILARS